MLILLCISQNRVNIEIILDIGDTSGDDLFRHLVHELVPYYDYKYFHQLSVYN